MPSYQEKIHKTAAQTLPNWPKKPTQFYVAILPYNVTVPTCQHGDFFWMKCGGRTTIANLRAAYIAQTDISVELAYGDRMKPEDHTQIRHLCHARTDILAFWTIVNTTEVLSLDVHPNFWAIANTMRAIWAGNTSPRDLMEMGLQAPFNRSLPQDAPQNPRLLPEELERFLTQYRQKYPRAKFRIQTGNSPALLCSDCLYKSKPRNGPVPFSDLDIHLESEEHRKNEHLSPDRAFTLLQHYIAAIDPNAKIAAKTNPVLSQFYRTPILFGCQVCDNFRTKPPKKISEFSRTWTYFKEHLMSDAHKLKLQTHHKHGFQQKSHEYLAERALHILSCLHFWFADAQLAIEALHKARGDPLSPFVIECLHCQSFTYRLSKTTKSYQAKSAFERHLDSTRHLSSGICLSKTRSTETAQPHISLKGQTSSAAAAQSSSNKQPIWPTVHVRLEALRSKYPNAEFEISLDLSSKRMRFFGVCRCDDKKYHGNSNSLFSLFETHLAKHHQPQQQDDTDSDIEPSMVFSKTSLNPNTSGLTKASQTSYGRTIPDNLVSEGEKALGSENRSLDFKAGNTSETKIDAFGHYKHKLKPETKVRKPLAGLEEQDVNSDRPKFRPPPTTSSSPPPQSLKCPEDSPPRASPTFKRPASLSISSNPPATTNHSPSLQAYQKYLALLRREFSKDNFRIQESTVPKSRKRIITGLCLDCDSKTFHGTPESMYRDLKNHLSSNLHLGKRFAQEIVELKTRAAGALKMTQNSFDSEYYQKRELKEFMRKRKTILGEFPTLIRKKRRVGDGES